MAEPDSPTSPKGPEEEYVHVKLPVKTMVPRYNTVPGYGQEDAECFCVRFSPNQRYLAASFSNGFISIYKAELGGHDSMLYDKPENFKGAVSQLPATCVRFRPGQNSSDSAMLAVTAEDNGRILHWDIKTKKCVNRLEEEGNQIFCVDYSADGLMFATGGIDRKVRIYDETTKTLVQTMEAGNDNKNEAGKGTGHANRILGLACHPLEPHTVVTGGWDKQLQVWDLRQGISVQSVWNVVLYGQAVSFSSDGNTLLTGSYRTRSQLQMWDLRKGQVIETPEWKGPEKMGNQSSLYAAAFSKDENSSLVVAGGSGSNEAKFFWRGEGKAVPFAGLVNMKKPCFSVDISPDGKLVAVGGGDGQVRVVEIRNSV